MAGSPDGDSVTMATSARSAVTAVAGVVAAGVVVAGALVVLLATSWPMHITHQISVPALQQTGEFDKALVPTGRTVQVEKTDTCVPLRRVIAIGGNDDPAVCHQRDETRLRVARLGLTAAAAGLAAVLVLTVVNEIADRRATRRGPRPRSTPAPR